MVMYVIAVATTKFGPRYFAMCLMVAGTYSGYVVALGYISNSTLFTCERVWFGTNSAIPCRSPPSSRRQAYHGPGFDQRAEQRLPDLLALFISR